MRLVVFVFVFVLVLAQVVHSDFSNPDDDDQWVELETVMDSERPATRGDIKRTDDRTTMLVQGEQAALKDQKLSDDGRTTMLVQGEQASLKKQIAYFSNVPALYFVLSFVGMVIFITMCYFLGFWVWQKLQDPH